MTKRTRITIPLIKMLLKERDAVVLRFPSVNMSDSRRSIFFQVGSYTQSLVFFEDLMIIESKHNVRIILEINPVAVERLEMDPHVIASRDSCDLQGNGN